MAEINATSQLIAATNAINAAAYMHDALSALHEQLEDHIYACGDGQVQGLFAAMGACIEKLGLAANEAMERAWAMHQLLPKDVQGAS